MSNLRAQFEQEDLQELLEDQFDPEVFYQALSNALQQLDDLDAEAA